MLLSSREATVCNPSLKKKMFFFSVLYFPAVSIFLHCKCNLVLDSNSSLTSVCSHAVVLVPPCAPSPIAPAIIPFPLSPHLTPRMPLPLCSAGAACSALTPSLPIQSNLQEPSDSCGVCHRVLSWTRSLARFAEYFADQETAHDLGSFAVEQGDTTA